MLFASAQSRQALTDRLVSWALVNQSPGTVYWNGAHRWLPRCALECMHKLRSVSGRYDRDTTASAKLQPSCICCRPQLPRNFHGRCSCNGPAATRVQPCATRVQPCAAVCSLHAAYSRPTDTVKGRYAAPCHRLTDAALARGVCCPASPRPSRGPAVCALAAQAARPSAAPWGRCTCRCCRRT